MNEDVFASAKWIWTARERRNQYVLFARTIELSGAAPLQIQIPNTHSLAIFTGTNG